MNTSQLIAIDAGSRNTIIISNGDIVVNETSCFEGRYPIRSGVISDFQASEKMLRLMIKRAKHNFSGLCLKRTMVITSSVGSGELEQRALLDICRNYGCRNVSIIFSPMAAAIGFGINIFNTEANMIVDIGEGGTDIAIIAEGKIVLCSWCNNRNDIDKYIRIIADSILNLLDKASLNHKESIKRNGVYITGGKILDNGFLDTFKNHLTLPINVSEIPLTLTAIGAYMALKDSKYISTLHRSAELLACSFIEQNQTLMHSEEIEFKLPDETNDYIPID